MGGALVATLGFDERHVLRNLVRLGFRGVEHVALLIPAWDIDARTRSAVEEIEKIYSVASGGRGSVETVAVDVTDFWKGVGEIRSYLTGLFPLYNQLHVSLGGGLRVLVAQALVAVLLLDQEKRRRTRVIIDLETGDGGVVFTPILPIDYVPSPTEIRVLRALLDGEKRLAEIIRETGLPKTTTWRTLNKLTEKGLVEKTPTLHYRLTGPGRAIALMAKTTE